MRSFIIDPIFLFPYTWPRQTSSKANRTRVTTSTLAAPKNYERALLRGRSYLGSKLIEFFLDSSFPNCPISKSIYQTQHFVLLYAQSNEVPALQLKLISTERLRHQPSYYKVASKVHLNLENHSLWPIPTICSVAVSKLQHI